MKKKTPLTPFESATKRVITEPAKVHDECNNHIHWLRMGNRRRSRAGERWMWRELREKAAVLLRGRA